MTGQTPDVLGRCEKGEGVLFLRDGNPVELRGWTPSQARLMSKSNL